MALLSARVKGYRLNWQGVPGRPDIAFPLQRIAVFVHGCYWHRCPHCDPSLPKKNRSFWDLKFRRNIGRDRRKVDTLRKLGWDSLVLWECQVKGSLSDCVARVLEKLSQSNHPLRQPGFGPTATAEGRASQPSVSRGGDSP